MPYHMPGEFVVQSDGGAIVQAGAEEGVVAEGKAFERCIGQSCLLQRNCFSPEFSLEHLSQKGPVHPVF